MERYILGLDIGGTKMAAGLLTEKSEIHFREEIPTEQHKGFEHSFGQMNRVISALLQRLRPNQSEIVGIGVCAPGPLDPLQGILFNPPNLKGWHDLALKDILEKQYGLPVYIDNDANAAGLAETYWGAAKGYDYVFYVTVSTGIGTGIIVNQKILHGNNGLAGEGGHVSIFFHDSAPRCNCGNAGCIEAYASGPSAAKRAQTKLRALSRKPVLLEEETGGDWDRLTMKHISAAARRGDRFSQTVIEETGTFLGIWLGSIVSLLDPGIIVIGGGVSEAGEGLFKAIREELPRRTLNRFAKRIPVVKAGLEKDVGIYGGAALALAHQAEERSPASL